VDIRPLFLSLTGLIKHHIRLLLAIFTFAFVALTAVTSANRALQSNPFTVVGLD
jgi:hypothetical protein